MKRSTIVYLIIGVLSLIIILPIKIMLIFINIPLFFYLIICFLEIYSPYSSKYTNGRFSHTMLKPEHNIIYKLSKLIDGNKDV